MHVHVYVDIHCELLQELTEEIGEALCALIDEGADRDGNSKR